jgi:hypothetical protein
MKKSVKMLAAFALLLMPAVSNAQKLGQIACSKQDGYVDLYSSIATLEIRATLKCGQQVQVLDRSDNFVHVMTDKGEDGFVAANSLLFVKTASAAKSTATRGKQKQSASAAQSDASARSSASAAPAPPREIILVRQTPVHLRLGRELSSATAHVGDEVNFEVSQDVIVGGITVIAKGAPGFGAVTEAEPKKRMGKAGKLNVAVNSVVLANNEKIILRSFGIEQSAEQKSGRTIPLLRGKDVTLAKDAEIIAYVDSDLHLKVASFAAARSHSATQALSQSESAKPQN